MVQVKLKYCEFTKRNKIKGQRANEPETDQAALMH